MFYPQFHVSIRAKTSLKDKHFSEYSLISFAQWYSLLNYSLLCLWFRIICFSLWLSPWMFHFRLVLYTNTDKLPRNAATTNVCLLHDWKQNKLELKHGMRLLFCWSHQLSSAQHESNDFQSHSMKSRHRTYP